MKLLRLCGVFFLTALAAAILAACNATEPQDQSHPCTTTTATKVSNATPDSQRFKPVEVYPVGMRVNLALDSYTGQLCRTWNWQTNGGKSPWNHLPTCASLNGQADGPSGLIEGP